jgi:hypothetical protein
MKRGVSWRRLGPSFGALGAVALMLLLSPAFARPMWAGHTKEQAEANLLRVAAQSRRYSRFGDLVDTKTNLLKNNVRAICRGQGRRLPRSRYSRFRCVLRPWPLRRRRELYVSYAVRANGTFHVHWLSFRQR